GVRRGADPSPRGARECGRIPPEAGPPAQGDGSAARIRPLRPVGRQGRRAPGAVSRLRRRSFPFTGKDLLLFSRYQRGQTAAALTASCACSTVHGSAASSGLCLPSAVIAIAASSRASAPTISPPAAELLSVTATVTPVLMSLYAA